jgi:cell division septum initiation protein DivIVA
MMQELNEFDYSKANKQSKANAQQFVAKMQAALEMTKNPGKSEALFNQSVEKP